MTTAKKKPNTVFESKINTKRSYKPTETPLEKKNKNKNQKIYKYYKICILINNAT